MRVKSNHGVGWAFFFPVFADLSCANRCGREQFSLRVGLFFFQVIADQPCANRCVSESSPAVGWLFYFASINRSALCKSVWQRVVRPWAGFFILPVPTDLSCANHCLSESSPASGWTFFISSACRLAVCKSLCGRE